MKRIFIRAAFFFYLPGLSFAHANNIFYVDSRNGNDNNNGKTNSTAWKTLSKVNTIIFHAGDLIYLKRGQSFNGSLILKGSGKNGKPIRLAAFGTGPRPIINSGDNEFAIRILDEQYWEIRDIETKGGEKAGIFIGCSKDGLVLNHFRIINCYVENVGNDNLLHWDFSMLTGGIVIVNGQMHETKKFSYNSIINDAIVDGCTVRYIKRWTCISISSGKINNVRGHANYIKNCIVEYSVADGIRMNGVRNSFIEHCTMYKNGGWPNSPNKDGGGLGAWFFDADSCTIQFCEASYIDNPHQDGGAFDIDYWQTNSTVQYCYGHDCHGYGVSVFGADSSFPTVNSVVRYNIFSNNARDSAYAYQGDFYVYTWNKGLLDGVKIYNNTSYWNPASGAACLKSDADFTGTNENIFKNNIIYSDHPWLVSLRNNRLECDNNIYWTTTGSAIWQFDSIKYHSLVDWQKQIKQDKLSKFADPLLSDPSYHGQKKPFLQSQLKPGSPAKDAGLNLGDMGGRDFSGNKVPGKNNKYNIGACAEINIAGKIERQKNTLHIPGKTTTAGEELNAPEFEIEGSNQVQQQRFTDYQGQPVLISFINVHCSSQAESEQSTRAQLTFVRSMERQYAGYGLKIILVDEGLHKREIHDETQINFISDNEFDHIRLVRDDKAKNIAKKYGVKNIPTTLLVSKAGVVHQRWDNTALPAQLAFAIENQLGIFFVTKKM